MDLWLLDDTLLGLDRLGDSNLYYLHGPMMLCSLRLKSFLFIILGYNQSNQQYAEASFAWRLHEGSWPSLRLTLVVYGVDSSHCRTVDPFMPYSVPRRSINPTIRVCLWLSRQARSYWAKRHLGLIVAKRHQVADCLIGHRRLHLPTAFGNLSKP